MALSTNVTNLATRIATEIKTVRAELAAKTGDLSTLTTTAKSSLVAAVNELVGLIAEASGIDDGTTSTGSSWSSSKTSDEINAAVQAMRDNLVNGAPTALDTLSELATALSDNDSDIAAVITALDNRVRFDATQALTGSQQAQARTNIGAASATDLGDPNADYVATFVAGLA